MRWGGALAIATWIAVVGPAPASPAHGAEEREGPRIYRWIDENGVAHYTTDRDRIPGALRGRIHRDPVVRAPRVEPRPREVEPVAPPPPSDVEAWAARDRRGSLPEDAWSEGGPEAAPESPAQIAARRAEEQARISEVDDRIAELEAAVEADEEALKDLISDPEAGGPLARSGDPEFRAIAERLPQRLAELRALRQERASLAVE